MKIKNITTGKVIGFGKDFTVLPGETREVPASYEKSPSIAQYEKLKFIEVIGAKATKGKRKPPATGSSENAKNAEAANEPAEEKKNNPAEEKKK